MLLLRLVLVRLINDNGMSIPLIPICVYCLGSLLSIGQIEQVKAMKKNELSSSALS